MTDPAPQTGATYTPVYDSLAAEHGIITAAVFGRIWRYTLGEQRVCTASLETISKDLGIDRATVMRHADKLQELGLIEDLTPTRRNHPHVFAITDKGACVPSGVAYSNTEIAEEPAAGVAESKSGVAESLTTVAQCNTGVAESYLKRGIKKEKKKEVKRVAADRSDLKIDATAGGEIIKRELDTCYGSKSPRRDAPQFYSNSQQRDLFLAVYSALNGQLETLTRKAISRDRVALPNLLAFLETCVRNNQSRSAQPAGKYDALMRSLEPNNGNS